MASPLRTGFEQASELLAAKPPPAAAQPLARRALFMDAEMEVQEPALPLRKRKGPDAGGASARPRRTTGAAGLVVLGASRVAYCNGGAMVLGTVTAWHNPWFEVSLDGGRSVRLRKHDVAPALLFTPAEFFDPRRFFFDFSVINPLSVPGWAAGLRSYLNFYSVEMPHEWLEPEMGPDAAGARGSGYAGGVVEEFRAGEDVRLQTILRDLAGESIAPSTLRSLKNPALKAVWWLASRGKALPPAADDVALYLTYLSSEVNTIGSASDARQALGFLATVNANRGWARDSMLGGRAAVPIEALRRRHAHAIDKAPGLPADVVRLVLNRYVVARTELPWDLQWRLAIGVAIGAAFKLMARYADMRVVVYDDDRFETFDLYIRVYLSGRKTHVYGGQWIDVAKPADDSFGVYHALLLGKHVFRSGHVLPHIDAEGRVHRERPMEYDDFVRHLRQALVTVGLSELEASGRVLGALDTLGGG
jgi:hypothetical protein